MYKIVRMYSTIKDREFMTKRSTVKTGLTLEEAQAHCCDPETSSKTAFGPKARRISRTNPGWAWWDSYTET